MVIRSSVLVVLFSALSILSFSVSASPVNVNKASVEEISSALSGIGPAKAMAISEHCKKMTCSKPEDLLAVKGIGEKTLAKISADLRFKDKK
ncbi:ComEA family DNA-binding protein [Thiomicrorhabdus lithotrophica]|uniref:Helix-hairpin-helix domain-containing protein n=1 Tax=Thiomicrorhabdus lithotrophica TaxID=2949997 RepID=A0ABY8CG73_9GAMM|nr:helix-hairpin-helix domain-containing protein [Thiomicrorhabdus lithotrophica]WEJ63153.1 helix-hairpin-helix domain-containing protein [Thiomicrorhabdus lithotrophica]